jgi:hypothetical protein
VFAIVRELAAEGVEEQRRDAANTFDGMLFKFAAWLVKDGDGSISRDDLYMLFTDADSGSVPPRWAVATGVTVALDQVRQWVKGKAALVEDMKRRNLLPKESRHTRTGDLYDLNKEQIMGVVEQYLGEVEFEVQTGPRASGSAYSRAWRPTYEDTTETQDMPF